MVSSQESTISALRDEVITLDLLTMDLRPENGSLTKRLEISERQFEEAEKRIRHLSGRRLRIRPPACLGRSFPRDGQRMVPRRRVGHCADLVTASEPCLHAI